MKRRKVVVDFVQDVSRPPWGDYIPVTLGPKAPKKRTHVESPGWRKPRTVWLDTTSDDGWEIWHSLLVEWQERQLPLYLELVNRRKKKDVIDRLLLPQNYRVWDVHGSDVALQVSAASHFVAPARRKLLARLRFAKKYGKLLLITIDVDGHEILDARTPLVAVLCEPPLGKSREFPPAPRKPVTVEQAQALFKYAAGKPCDPCGHPLGCNPFSYPINGCWARAHDMCRRIKSCPRVHLTPSQYPLKIWVHGLYGDTLYVPTPYRKTCSVEWSYHVAPTLRVKNGAAAEPFVIDPVICPGGPVPLQAWLARLNTEVYTQETSMEAFIPDLPSQSPHFRFYPDVAYVCTDWTLWYLSRQFRNQTKFQGKPPFKGCPPLVPCPKSGKSTQSEPGSRASRAEIPAGSARRRQ